MISLYKIGQVVKFKLSTFNIDLKLKFNKTKKKLFIFILKLAQYVERESVFILKRTKIYLSIVARQRLKLTSLHFLCT